MSSSHNRAAGWAIALGQYDDGLATFYNVDLGASPGHIQYNGIGRIGVRFDAGASGINAAVKSILVRLIRDMIIDKKAIDGSLRSKDIWDAFLDSVDWNQSPINLSQWILSSLEKSRRRDLTNHLRMF